VAPARFLEVAPGSVLFPLDWNPQSGQIIKNVGATRYLTDIVDFSTAKITERQIGSHGKLTIAEVAEDHVVMRMVHPPAGKRDFIYTVTFEK
jgi:hypothetical protein